MLHRPGALDDLRQEHLAGAEQLADDAHAVHQRPFDHVERARLGETRFLDVLLDELHDAVDERVREPLVHTALAPGEIDRPRWPLPLTRPGELDEPFGRVGPPVEDHVFDVRRADRPGSLRRRPAARR